MKKHHCTWTSVFNCVCVCCRRLYRSVCPNHEVVEFQPRTVTNTYLGSDANTYTIFPTLLPHQFQPCSGSSFTPPPLVLSHIAPPYFTRRHRFSLLLYPLPSPPLSWSRSNRTPGRPPPRPLTATARLRFPTLWWPKEVPCASRACLPLSVAPPLPSSTFAQVLVCPRVLPSGGTLLPLPASFNITPAPPSCQP